MRRRILCLCREAEPFSEDINSGEFKRDMAAIFVMYFSAGGMVAGDTACQQSAAIFCALGIFFQTCVRYGRVEKDTLATERGSLERSRRQAQPFLLIHSPTSLDGNCYYSCGGGARVLPTLHVRVLWLRPRRRQNFRSFFPWHLRVCTLT